MSGWSGAGTPGPVGPEGPAGPAGVAPAGIAATTIAPNRFVTRKSTGIGLHDGSESSALALLGGGMCVTGGAMGSTVTYYTSGPAPVGATGWIQDVPLYPIGAGGMVPRDHASLNGQFSRPCGIYDGANFNVAIGPVEDFT